MTDKIITNKTKHKKWHGTEIVSTIVVLIFVILIIIPFWNAIVLSFESQKGAAHNPFSLFPTEFTLKNYEYLLGKGSRLLTAYKSTILMTLVGTVAGMTVSVMAAYAYSRRFPGKKLFFLMMVFTMFFGGGLVPTYLLIRNLGLIDSYAASILVGLASAYNIIIMKNGFEATPPDLEEAATIDGATDIQIFVKVMIPLQKPLIATFSLFTAVGYWNSWYWPLLTLNSIEKTTLQLYLKSIIEQANMKEDQVVISQQIVYAQGIRMASVFLVILPIMMVYPFLQKYFVKGMLVGAVKM